MKPGYLTTEFWATVLTAVATVVAASADWLPPRYSALASAVVVGLYAVARGWAKSSTIPVVVGTTPAPPPAPPEPPGP